jgi:hypothetical protein
MSVLSDPEREQALARILRAAAAVCEGGWIPEEGHEFYPAAVQALADALDALPLAERLRYGL